MVLFIAATQVAYANTYYVDNVSGLDINDGLSSGTAWKTLSKSTSIASAGDTVNVINNGATNPFHERLAPQRDGTSGSHIRFIGTGGSPYILGTIDYSHSVSTGWIWKPSAVSGEYYLTKNNLNPSITQARILATSIESSWTSSGVDALSYRSTGTIGSLSAGQWNWGNNDSLGYNTIYYKLAAEESDITTIHIEGGEDSAQHSSPILVAWQYIDIENFKVRYTNHAGILNQTKANYNTYTNVDSSYTGRAGISNGIYTNMTVTNSRFDHNGMLSTVRADYAGIQLSGTTNCTITNNIISNGNNDSGINVKASSNNNYIAKNIIFNNAQHGIDISTTSLNNNLYNNTLYNNAEQGINVETNSSGNVIKNNIMAENQVYQLSVFDVGSTAGLILDNNLLYFHSPATNMIRFVGSFYSMNTFSTYKSDKGQDTNSLAGNPTFLNGSGAYNQVEDFKLSRPSIGINSGASVGILSDYLGTTVPQAGVSDIGAYEYIPLSATINQAVGQTDPTSDNTINFTVVFSESVSDFVTGDVTLSGTAGATSANITGSGTSYNVAVSGMSGSGDIVVSINSDVATGASGNTNAVATSTDSMVNYEVYISNQTPSNNSTTSNDVINYGPSCDDLKPSSVPDLFQIDVTSTTAKLFFTPISNTNDYYFSYSRNPSAQEYGTDKVTLAREGVQNFTIQGLNQNTVYYFKIRGHNGCRSGDWSNIMSIKTKVFGSGKSIVYYNLQTPIKKILSTLSTKIVSKTPIISTITTIPEEKITPPPTADRSDKASKKCYLWGLICI